MGAWGEGHFENDTALDWIYDLKPPKKRLFGLLQADPISYCLDTVTPVIDSHYVDADAACELLAAAECIALVRGHPAHELPEDIHDWHQQIKHIHTQAGEDHIVQWVIEAVQRVKSPTESELNELWEETEDYPNWLAAVDDLIERLRLPPEMPTNSIIN